MTEHVSQSEEDCTIKYNVYTTLSDVQITRSSLQKFFRENQHLCHYSLVLMQAVGLSYIELRYVSFKIVTVI